MLFPHTGVEVTECGIKYSVPCSYLAAELENNPSKKGWGTGQRRERSKILRSNFSFTVLKHSFDFGKSQKIKSPFKLLESSDGWNVKVRLWNGLPIRNKRKCMDVYLYSNLYKIIYKLIQKGSTARLFNQTIMP